MKWTTILVLIVVVAVVAEARRTPEEKAAREAEKAERKAAKQSRKHKNKACKYDFKGAICNQTTNKMEAPLIEGESTDPNCEAAKTMRRSCDQMRCIYNKRAATCDTSLAEPKRTAQLVTDRSDANCPATKDFPCKMKKHNRKANRGCKYSLEGATCDSTTMELRKPLQTGSPDTCEPYKVKTVRKCPNMDRLREKLAKRAQKRGNGGKNRL